MVASENWWHVMTVALPLVWIAATTVSGGIVMLVNNAVASVIAFLLMLNAVTMMVEVASLELVAAFEVVNCVVAKFKIFQALLPLFLSISMILSYSIYFFITNTCLIRL